MKNLTAEETAKADMEKEFNTVLLEDTAVVYAGHVKELYSKSIEFIPNRKHGIRTTIGYINLWHERHTIS